MNLSNKDDGGSVVNALSPTEENGTKGETDGCTGQHSP